jgi:phosphatidylinositol glycan class B
MDYSTTIALVIRVAIALATRTFFQPDEYFQALEPAHFLVFGYGDLTWEWTSKPPIRSIIYPALNVPIYWLLKNFRLDGTSLLVRCSNVLFFFQNYHNRFPHGVKITAPKVLHGLMAAGTDIWVRELSRKTLGQSYVPATVRVAHLLLALSNTGCSPVLSLFDVLFSCTILVSLDVQLLRNDTHNCRDVLLSMGLFCSSH